MSAPKVGDRVKVAFEGVVTNTSHIDGTVQVTYRDFIAWVANDACTVITLPIKVGHVVTAENIGQLPIGSIVARDGWAPMHLRGDGIWHAPFGIESNAEDVCDPASAGARVLRIGGSS